MSPYFQVFVVYVLCVEAHIILLYNQDIVIQNDVGICLGNSCGTDDGLGVNDETIRLWVPTVDTITNTDVNFYSRIVLFMD